MSGSYSFMHGLGDAASFAHVIKLYANRGYDYEIQTTPCKECLFDAAGARITPAAMGSHPFYYPPGMSLHWDYPDQMPGSTWDNVAQWNKIGASISRAPLDQIGQPHELWHELCSVKLTLPVSDEERRTVDGFVAQLPRPLILTHLQGTTGGHLKNPSHHEQMLLLHHLLDKTTGTILSLDWDNRVYKCNSYRCRHLGQFKALSVPELTYLMSIADLFIGVDSGPAHLVRWTDTPAVVLWYRHYPSFFCLPRTHTLNVAGPKWAGHDKYRRHEFTTVLSDPSDMGRLADLAVKMLGPRLYASSPAHDVQLQHFVNRMRTHSQKLSCYVDRNRTFDKAFRHLLATPDPVVVETGCIRSLDDVGAGFSTFLFALLLDRNNKGSFTTVDLNPANLNFARDCLRPYKGVSFALAHSHDYLRAYKGKAIDLFYSDSQDVGVPGYEECCLQECKLVMPYLAPGAKILIDDTVWAGNWTGKGATAVPYLLAQGWRIDYAGYQVLMSK